MGAIRDFGQSISDRWNAPAVPIEKTEKSVFAELMPIARQEEIEAALDTSSLQENQLVMIYVIALKRVNGKAQWQVMMQQELNLDQYKKYVELTVQSLQNTAWWSSTYTNAAGGMGAFVNMVILPQFARPVLEWGPVFKNKYTWVTNLEAKYPKLQAIVSLLNKESKLTPDAVKRWEKQIISSGNQIFQVVTSQAQIQGQLGQGPQHYYSSKSDQLNKITEIAGGRKQEIRQDQMAIFQMLEQLSQQMSKLNEKTNQAS